MQREFAAQSFYERLDRLNAIGHALITANKLICNQHGRVRKSLGITVDYFSKRDSKEWYQALSRMWKVSENTLVVTGVIQGSAAANAGVLRGDIIKAVNGRVYDLAGKRTNVTMKLNDLSAKGAVTLKLLRDGKPLSLTILTSEDVCDTSFAVLISDTVNAFADGKTVFASYGIMNLFPKDEDLALVIGHELAHNILGHVRRDGFGKRVPSSPEKEAEADTIGLYFAARAGFCIENAPSIWRRMAAQRPSSINGGTVHPSSASRFVDLENVKNEIMHLKAAGLPLIPKPRVTPGL